MKNLKNTTNLLAGIAIFCIIYMFSPMAAFAAGGLMMIPQASGSVALMAVTPDLSALTADFVKFGGVILRKSVNLMDLGLGWTVYKSVKEPVAMPKLSALGNPKPYTAADETTGNGAKFTDRILTVHQSKWDFDIDPEQYRNTYLASDSKAPFYQFILDQVAEEYQAAINDSVLLSGVYDAAGTTAAAIGNGIKTIMAAEVTATNKTAIAVGTIDATNAVTKVETFASAHQSWKREQSGVIFCSFATFDNYKKHYRTLNAFGFQPRQNGAYYLDGFKDIQLKGVSWMKTNGGLCSSFKNAFAFGTDGDRIQVAASTRRNIIEVRNMMPVGLQVSDLDLVEVSDTFVA